MKNIRYDPYLYNPNNSYLSTSDGLSHFNTSDRLSKQGQVSPRDAHDTHTRRKASRVFSSHFYFQLEFQIIAIFIVSTFLILWFLFNNTAFWKIFQ
jgi:hypothetical protein